MPGKKRRFRRKTSRKWRQQKLAVGTVQKIARRVAKIQIEKKEEPKYALTILGSKPGNNTEDPLRCVITKTGLYKIYPSSSGNLANVDQFNLQHHPMTYPYDVVQGQAGAVEKVTTGYGMRAGDTISLKGIGFKGFLCLGKSCANARVHLGIYKSESDLTGQNSTDRPVDLLPPLDGMVVRREIENTEKLNGTKAIKTFTLNHRADDNEVKIPVNLYLPTSRRIRYNKNQPDRDAGLMAQSQYEDLRYHFVCFSDVKDDALTGGISSTIPNSDYQATLDRFPTLYGRWTAYYRDS